MNNCLFKCRGPSQLAGAPLHFLVGRGIRVGVIPPEHVLAQLGAHGLHLVLSQLGPLGVEEGAVVLVLGIPARKTQFVKKYRRTHHLLLTYKLFQIIIYL